MSALSAKRSSATVRKAHRVVSMVLDLAVRDHKVTRNVAEKVNLPRATSRKRQYLDHHQVTALVSEMKPSDALIVPVLAYCGLRWGEMAALQVSSVDTMRRRLSVDASVTEVRGRLLWGCRRTTSGARCPSPSSWSTDRWCTAPVAPLRRCCFLPTRGRHCGYATFGGTCSTALRDRLA